MERGTARRELLEELERSDLEIGPCIGTRPGGTVAFGRARFVQEERFYLCRAPSFEVVPELVDRVVAGAVPAADTDLGW